MTAGAPAAAPAAARPHTRLRRPRLFSRWTLRTRLVAGLLALLVAACAIVGTATTLALRGFLVDQLDQQLTAAGKRNVQHGLGGGQGAQPRPAPPGNQGYNDRAPPFDIGPVPGQASGTVSARVIGGTTVEAGVVTDTGPTAALSSGALATVASLPADGSIQTLHLDRLGDYRLTAVTSADGDVFVTGLPLRGVDETVTRLLAIEVVVFGVVLALALGVGALLVRLTLRPLERMTRTAIGVAGLPLGSGEVSLPHRTGPEHPDTEVGQLGAAFDHMLEHIESALSQRQASEMRVRRFVADASHELRTPLAAIRGHAELALGGTDPLTPDVEQALRRVEAESRRMGSLVDDMLLLARLDAGRPLVREPVDLTRLAIDVASDARAGAPGHRWVLDLPEEPVIVVGDDTRLHQVLANLLRNAAVHTAAGTTVTVRVRADAGGGAALVVDDDGPGIAPTLRPHVFERFVRGDAARSRQAGSTGLGLAIVAAVVHAHQGSIRLDDSAVRGTRVVIDLPKGEAQRRVRGS